MGRSRHSRGAPCSSESSIVAELIPTPVFWPGFPWLRLRGRSSPNKGGGSLHRRARSDLTWRYLAASPRAGSKPSVVVILVTGKVGTAVYNRVVNATAAVSVIAAVVAGCSSESRARVEARTIKVLINGSDTGHHLVDCTQVRWLWTLKTLKDDPGITAQLETGGDVVAKLVQINNLGGFTGTFGQDVTGAAQASLRNGTFTIVGTAVGWYDDKPGERSSARFEIITAC